MGEKKRMKKNPRTGRRTVYLGHRVKDTREPGLDSLREVEDICRAIINDFRSGRITRKTASGRFAKLHNTILPRDSDFKGEKLKKALELVEEYWDKI